MKNLKFFVILLVFLIIFMYFFDKSRIQNNKNPLFTFFTIKYKDEGTKSKIGIGYSVIIWNEVASINLNNTKIDGNNIGTEFINFPLCYLNIFNHNIKPKIELQFVPEEGFKELYETNNNEYFNVKIIRDENNGFMNLVPCSVFIYNENVDLINCDNVKVFDLEEKKQLNRNKNNYILLIGGDTAFLRLHSGRYSIKIITPKEDQMRYLESFDKDWESKSYDFKINFEEYEEIKIFPGGDYGYDGTWIIE